MAMILKRMLRKDSIKKKGVFFTIDAILGISLLIIVLLAATNYYVSEQPSTNLNFVSKDFLNIFSNGKIRDINNSYLNLLIENGTADNINMTLIQFIGELSVTERESIAFDLIKNLSKPLIGDRYGFGVWITNNLTYKNKEYEGKEIIGSRRMISGIERGRPVRGTASRAYLTGIDSKLTSSYAYFGGFVGQGNLSVKMEDITSDATMQELYMQVDAGDEFNLYINDIYCGHFVPTYENMSADAWDITYCNESISLGGENNFEMTFPNNLLNQSYIGGGFIRARYINSQMLKNNTYGLKKVWLPGIDGLINLYSSFDVPGTINSLGIYLHYYSNYGTYFTVGNVTIMNTTGSSFDQAFSVQADTPYLTGATIPIRIGTKNISQFINSSGVPSDTVLVTDVSGSMDECGEYGVTQMCQYECRVCFLWFFCWWETQQCPYTGTCSGDQCSSCSSGNTQNNQVVDASTCLKTKMEIAKEADNLFVDTVLNYSGTRVGLTSYSSSLISSDVVDLTNNEILLKNTIDDYEADGMTCICCGINRAKNMLITSSNKRYMVVMSDGEANYGCDNFNDYTGSSSSNAKQDAIDAGQNACDNHDIEVYAVGFGEDADHETLKQIACNVSMYYNATNTSMLTEIYHEIGENIILASNFSSQTIEISGDFVKTMLYPDSYIEINYTPTEEKPDFGEISVTVESSMFDNCTGNVYIPKEIRVLDAKMTSYSSEHWTDMLKVNGNVAFNLSYYGEDYTELGDPFIVSVPPTMLNEGANNTIELRTGDIPENSTGCSDNNSLIYEGVIKASISYTTVLPNTEGCSWIVGFEDGENGTLTVPPDYSGDKQCSYMHGNISYDTEDSYDDSVYNLLNQLDFDNDGRIFINFNENDLIVQILSIPQVPYMWGPAILEVRTWK